MAYYKDKKTGKTYTSPGTNRVQVAGSEGSAGANKEVNKTPTRDTSKGFKASSNKPKTAGDIIKESRTDQKNPTTGSWDKVSQLANAEEERQATLKQQQTTQRDETQFSSVAAHGKVVEEKKDWKGNLIQIHEDGFQNKVETMTIGEGIKDLGVGGVLAAFGASSIQAAPAVISTGKQLISSAITKALTSTTGQAATTGTTTTQINAKNVKIINNLITKELTKKGILSTSSGLLTKIAGAAGLVFLGMWGQAESGEPLSIAMRDISYEAKKTGNWDLYNEAAEIRNEIIDLEIWEQAAMWTPLAPLIGITNKIKGVKAAAVIQDKFAKSQQTAQENNETPQQTAIREQQEEQNDYKANIDYYNEQRKKLLQWEEEAADRDMKEDAAFWAAEREKQRQKEAEDRQAIAQFWNAYRKEQQKISDDNRPSNLNFGLI